MSVPTTTGMSAALEWHTAAMPAPGETVLGDCAVVSFADGRALAAVVDGLGHGAEAAAAARVAACVLEHSAGQDPAAVVTECHRALHDTRGAALSLASIDLGKDTMSWLGVGNVEARLLRAREPVPVADSPLLHSGIVGLDLPRIAVQSTNIARGDVLIFATDGIRREFADDLAPTGSCQDIAERILHQHTLGTDDALVLVARYLERR